MDRINVDLLATPAFSVSVGGDGSFRYDGINAAITVLSGLTKAMRLGLTPHQCNPADVADRMVANYQRCAESRTLFEYEEQLLHPAGEKWWRTSLSPVVDSAGRIVQVLGLCVDITDRKAAEIDLQSAAYKDPLTGVCNRRRHEVDLALAIEKGKPFSLVFADVDRFKPINDTYGHLVGDEVLVAIAWRLALGVKKADRLARIGGDEFAVIATAGTEGALLVASVRMRRQLLTRVETSKGEIAISVSLGGAVWRPGMSAMELAEVADRNLYANKGRSAAAAASAVSSSSA